MKKILKEEIRRAICSPRFIGAILLGICFLGFGAFRMITERSWISEGFSFADLWYFAYSSAYFPFILPLIAVIPYADSLAEERAEGFFRQAAFRGGFRKMLLAKMIANALVAMLVILISLAVLYLFASIYLPRASFPHAVWEEKISGRPYGIWMDFFMAHPDAFILTVSLLAGLMGALYASFGMAISLLTVNRYLVWALPTSFYLLSHFVATKTRLFGVSWSPAVAILGESWYDFTSTAALWLHPLSLCGMILLLVFIAGKREQVLMGGGS